VNTRILPYLSLGLLATLVFLLAGCGKEEPKPEPAAESAAATTQKLTDIPSLQEQLDARRAEFEQKAPPERVKTFNDAVAEVAASGVLESALKVGDTAPDFTLLNACHDTVTFSDELKKGPVVLAWYRGGWCPYCSLELRALEHALDNIEATGAHLVVISPEIPDSAYSTSFRDSLAYEVLSDSGNVVGKKFGIVYTLPKSLQEAFKGKLDLEAYNADTSNQLPLAVTYVVDTNSVIRYAFVDPDYRKRAEPSAIVAALLKLHQS